MRIMIGIDLGSTTTKAVVLDEAGDVLGRGITNSRSNYDVACAVARNEALIDARFNLFRARSGLDDLDADVRDGIMNRLELGFRREQYLGQLDALDGACNQHLDDPRFTDVRKPATEVLASAFATLRNDARVLFSEEGDRRSNFFRDLAGSRLLELMEPLCRDAQVPFDLMMGLYDKSIIGVENHVPEVTFERNVMCALDDAVSAHAFDEVRRNALRSQLEGAAREPLTEASVVGTGYGRARLPFPRENIRSEILCHGLGAHAMFPGTRTVLDIGGQDTKAIQVDADGLVASFQMNDRCAAGCGRYLGYIADEMNMGVQDLGPMALRAKAPVKINSTCTVFAGAELRDRLAIGQRREDILGGLHRAMILRAMSLLARSGGINDEFTFTGGVANNAAAVRALQRLIKENYGERHLNISPDSIYTGALGAALFAQRQADERKEVA